MPTLQERYFEPLKEKVVSFYRFVFWPIDPLFMSLVIYTH